MYKSQKDIKEIIGENLQYSFFGPQWIADAMRKNGKMHRDFNGFVEQGNEIISKFPILNATNEFYHKNKVIGSKEESFRIKLVEAFRNTLKNSLHLLGIEAMDEM